MATLGIIVSYRCNLACSYCFNETHEDSVAYGYSGRSPRPYDVVMVQDCIEACRVRGYTAVTITGGEPMLSNRTRWWVDASAQAGLALTVITNLTTIPVQIFEALRVHPNVTVAVSLGGANETSHDRYRSSWRASRTNLDRLGKYGIRISLSYVLDRDNLSELAEAERLAARIGAELHIAPLSRPDSADRDFPQSFTSVSADEWGRVIGEVRSPTVARELRIVRAFYNGHLTVRSCAMRTKSQIIDPFGDVYGCFWRKDVHWGNVCEESLGDILDRIDRDTIWAAPCFGEHCLTMLYN